MTDMDGMGAEMAKSMRQRDEEMFETLLGEYGTGWVQSCIASHAGVMDEDGAGRSALIGFTVAGMSAATIVNDEPHAVFDRDHRWMVTFAASKEALVEIVASLQQTIDAIERADAADSNGQQLGLILPGGSEAESDGDPGAESGEAS